MRDNLKKGLGTGAAALMVCSILLGGRVGATTIPLPPQKPAEAAFIADVSLRVPVPVPSAKPLSEAAVSAAPDDTPMPQRKPVRKAPGPLTGADADLYREIFVCQTKNDWACADALITQLGDRRLLGHILYERYMHPTAYSSGFEELERWLDAYADHPGADKIYKLAEKRRPTDYAGSLKKPIRDSGINGYLDILSDDGRSYVTSRSRSTEENRALQTLKRAISADITRNHPAQAYKKLQHDPAAKLLDAVEYDMLQAEIANRYMVMGKLAKAGELAQASAKRSGARVPLAGWVGGLVSWRQGRYKEAASLFEQTATSPYASSWTISGGAYWASRAHMRAGHTREVGKWLQAAAAHPRTFYGLIATRALGWDFDFNWNMPAYTAAHKKLLMKFPQAQRAMLLVEAGQYHLAEQELRRIDPKGNALLTEALLAFANDAELPSYAMRLAASVPRPDGTLYDAALFPLLPWTPQAGYSVDRALIHALIRQESKFDPQAENRSGATGLMQLMPRTASFVSGERAFRSREGQHSLKDPQVNLDIGQRYLQNLLRERHVGTELFSLVTAYNAGPGNLKKWQDAWPDLQDDPLLFVESIPLGETRAFVEKVMANYWIYRMRLGQDTPSLDAVAGGNPALYVKLDGMETAKAATAQPYRVADSSNYH